MPQVKIPDIGVVNFPDSMSQDEIASSIKEKIIPQYQAKQQATGKMLQDVLGQSHTTLPNSAGPEELGPTQMGALGTLSDIQTGIQHQTPPQAQTVPQGLQNFGINTISSLTDPKTAVIGLGLGGLGLVPKIGVPLMRLALLGLGTKIGSEGLGQASPGSGATPGERTEGLLNAGTAGLMALGGVLPGAKAEVPVHLQAQPPRPLTVKEINLRAGLEPRQNKSAIPMGSGQSLDTTAPFEKGKVLPNKPAKMDVPATKLDISKIPTEELSQRYNDVQAGAKTLMQQGNLPEANNLIVRGQFLREELQRRSKPSESSPASGTPAPPVKAEVTPPALTFKPAVRVEGKVTEGAHGAAAQKAFNEAQAAGVPKPKVQRGFVDSQGNWYATPMEVARKQMEQQAPQPKVTNEKENETKVQPIGVLGREGALPQKEPGNVGAGERGSQQSNARGKSQALTKEEKAVEQERLRGVLGGESGFVDVKAIADSVEDFAKEKIAPAWQEFKKVYERHSLRASGEALPFHAQQDKELGNKAYLVGQAPAIANRLAEVDPKIVLNGAKEDSEFDQVLGSVWTEAQLRDKRSALQEQGRDEEASKVETVVGNGRSPIKDEAHYQSLLRNPQVQEASMDFKRLIGNKAQARQENLGGKIARQPGMGFVNLLVKDEPKQVATSGLRGAQLKGSALNRTRTGTGTSYDVSATRMMQNAIKANYYRSALADYYKEAEKKGVGLWVKAGEKVPEGYVAVPQDVTKLIIKDEEGGVTVKTIRKDFYLKKEVMPEFRRITNLDRDALIQNDHKLAEFLTKLQVEAGIDALGHSGNIVAAVNSAAKDSLGKNIIGGREASTIADITKVVGQELGSKPEFLHVAHQMAERGILREAHTMQGLLGEFSPGGAIIKHLDIAGRQVLYRAAVDMANKGLGKADVVDIRRQIDKQLGQYNPRLMTAWQHIMRSVFSPFSVASRTFNSLATQRLLLSPGFQAANKTAWAKLAARQLAYAATAYFVAPMILNYEQTGELFPEGVKFGEGVVSKNKDGTYKTFDFLKLNFLRRAMRVTGVGKVIEGQVLPRLRGEPVQSLDSTARSAAMDVIGGKIAPYTAGPIPQASTALILGKSPAGYDLREKGENQPPYFKAALRTLNPVSGSLMQGAARGDTAAPLVKRLEQTVGLGSSSKPEQIVNGLRRQFLYKLGKAKQADYPPSDYDTLKSLLAKGETDEAKKEYARLLAEKTEEHQFGKDPEGEARKQLQTYFSTYAKGHGNVSKEDEAAFVKTLSPHQVDLYNEVMKQKQAIADAFFALQPKQSKKGNFGFGSLKF